MAVIPVFVSSTFRDFHAERDELVASVVPALDELVVDYGCRVELIDLRWGVTAAEDHERFARVLEVCLSEIDRARPLFVGLLGDRYGWVPDDYQLANAVRGTDAPEYTAGISVTALEFEHGALSRPIGESVFLEREVVGDVPSDWRDTDVSRAAALKDRVREHCEVHTYRAVCEAGRVADFTDFVECATSVIGERVVRRAQEMAGNRGDSTAAAELLFFDDRLRAFGGRSELVATAAARIRQGRGVCLYGESGAGKSAVWCALVRELSSSGARTVAVPVGAAPELSTLRGVLNRVCTLLGVEVPQDVSIVDLESYTRAALSAAAPLVLAVDGIDQLPGQARPTFVAGLPSTVTPLISTTVLEQAQYATAAQIAVVDVMPMSPEDGRDAVAAMCSSMGRSLPPTAVDHLTAAPRSPLWLRLAVGELSALGADDFGSIDPTGDPIEEIARLVTATVVELPSSTSDLLERIINRAGVRFGEDAVRTMLSLAAASRSGLRPKDFAELTGLDTLTVAGIRRAVAGLLVPRGEGGRLGFSHSSIRQYVMDHLVANESRLHRSLAHHYERYDEDDLCQEDRLWHAFRDHGASAAGILNSVTGHRMHGFAGVVLDSMSVPGMEESLRGLDARGIGFLAQMVLDHKASMRSRERITLAINVFMAAKHIAGYGELDDTALRGLANAACCLADLPSAMGIDLTESAEAAQVFTASLVARYPESMAAHEAHALTAMWVAREIASETDKALAASRTGVEEWQWAFAREPSLRVKSWLQFALIECGGAELLAGQIDSARMRYESALLLTRELRDVQNAQTMRNVNVVNAVLGLANCADANGNQQDALAWFGEAASLAKADYAEDPGRGATEQMAQVSRLYGMALSEASYTDESYQWLSVADSLFHALLARDPGNSHWPFGIDAAARAAAAELLLGRAVEASARIQRAVATAPDTDEARRVAGQTLIEGARSAERADNHHGAAQIAASVLDIFSDGQSAGYRSTLTADALLVQAHAQWALGAREDGVRLMRRSLEWRVRSLADPAAWDYTKQARRYGYSLVELAYMCPETEQRSTADEIVEHWNRHLGDDRGEGARSNEWLAKRLSSLALNVPDLATPLLSIAWRHARQLYDSNPANDEYRASLAGVIDVTGVVAAKAGQLVAAAEAWQNAASLLGTTPSAHEAVVAMRRSVATNLHRVCSETGLTPELSSRCLAAAVILLKLNGTEFDLPDRRNKPGTRPRGC